MYIYLEEFQAEHDHIYEYQAYTSAMNQQVLTHLVPGHFVSNSGYWVSENIYNKIKYLNKVRVS